MYSTKLKDKRFSADCIIVCDKVRIIKFVVDTGAMITCCQYTAFDKCLRERDFAGNEEKYLGGFVRSEPIKFYQYSLKQFTIGNINLGKKKIWITFDKRVTDTVLCMDILSQIIFIANPFVQKLYFCEDVEDYNNFELRN